MQRKELINFYEGQIVRCRQSLMAGCDAPKAFEIRITHLENEIAKLNNCRQERLGRWC